MLRIFFLCTVLSVNVYAMQDLETELRGRNERGDQEILLRVQDMIMRSSSTEEIKEEIRKLKNHAIADELGNTLLHLAVEYGNSDHVLLIMNEAKIDFNIKNNEGETPLCSYFKRAKEDLEVLRTISHYSDLNVDYKGKPIIFEAITYQNAELVGILLKGGAESNIKGRVEIGDSVRSMTPLEYAEYLRDEEREGEEVMQLLNRVSGFLQENARKKLGTSLFFSTLINERGLPRKYMRNTKKFN